MEYELYSDYSKLNNRNVDQILVNIFDLISVYFDVCFEGIVEKWHHADLI